MANSTSNEQPGRVIFSLFSVYYATIVCISTIGNILIISAVCKHKHMRTVVNGFLLNLAASDLFFTFLSVFDAINFWYDEWRIGDVACRFQSVFIEVTYTVSVLTLAAVAIERYMSICFPYKAKRTFRNGLIISICIWTVAFIFCSPLFYGYATRYEMRENGETKLICANDNWSGNSRRTFYSIHSILVYLIPLIVLCLSHARISKVLLRQKKYRSNTIRSVYTHQSQTNETNKHSTGTMSNGSNVDSLENGKKINKQADHRLKIIKLLVVVTVIFFILWTPFIMIRLLLYFDVSVHEMIWRATQLLILTSTAINCIIYALMSPAFKAAFKGFLTCDSSKNQIVTMNTSLSRSFDVTDTMKKQSSVHQNVGRN